MLFSIFPFKTVFKILMEKSLSVRVIVWGPSNGVNTTQQRHGQLK